MPHKQCICQICNCGRHRCPHRSGRASIEVGDNVPCAISEYGSRFTGDTAERVEGFKPKNQPFRAPETQMERLSTTAQDYPSHPVQTTDDFRPRQEYAQPRQAMDLNTTYNVVYEGRQGEREQSYRPANGVIGGSQFRAKATAQEKSDAESRAFQTEESAVLAPGRHNGKTAMYGNAENYENVGDSQSHDDYKNRTAMLARPVRIKRSLSDHLILGEDSPTYNSTNHADYAGKFPVNPREVLRLADGVDQRHDHITLGTGTPRKMLSTNHADYLNYPVNRTGPARRSVNFLNDSGFSFGEDDLTAEDRPGPLCAVNPNAAGIKTDHQDLFRSSAGLLFGGPTSARYVTQSQADYPGVGVAAARDRLTAQMNKEHWLRSGGIVFGEDSPEGRLKVTSNGVYGKEDPAERATRVQRNLFRPTNGFDLSYENNGSPRYSGAKLAAKRLRSVQTEGSVVNGANREEDEWEIYSEKERQQQRRRQRRSNRRNRHGSSRLASTMTSPRNVRHREASVASSNRLSLAQLEDQVRGISRATLDSNGLLWFPADDQSNTRKGLPKWAATALKSEKTTASKPGGEKQTPPEGVNQAQIDSLEQSLSTHAGNYAKQNDPAATTGQAKKKSIPSSTSDEGLVLDDSSLQQRRVSRQQKAQDEAARVPTAVSVYSRDSMENESADDSEGFDSLDSLERARSVSVLENGVNHGDEHIEALTVPSAAAEESSLLERTRDKMQMPKLIPAPRDDNENRIGQANKASEAITKLEVENQGETGMINGGHEQANADLQSGQKEEDAKVQLQDTLSGSPSQPTEEPEKTKKLSKQASQTGESASNLDQNAQQQTSLTKINQQSSSIATQQPSGTPAINARLGAGNQAVESQSLASPNKRKGRRVMSNANSQRNQYPRATTLGGLMKQGYLEQTTTSQNDYQAIKPKDAPTPKPRFVKKVPISENGEYVLTTSRPLQHSPRNAQVEAAGLKRTEIERRTTEATTRSSPVPAGSRKVSAESKTSKTSADGVPETRSSRRKKSGSHRMPANWERTLPIRYADTLRFEGERAGNLQSLSQQDYRGEQLSDSRPQSLDRKLLRSQIADIWNSSSQEVDRGSLRRNRSQDPQDYRAMFADRRVPFSYKDHDIFQGVREKFDARTENSEAFQNLQGGNRSSPIKPVNQLQLFSGRSAPGSGPRTVSQDVYKGRQNQHARREAFRPEPLLNIFDGPNAANQLSTSQDAYQKLQPQERRKPLRPRSAMSSGIYTEVSSASSSGRSRRRKLLHSSSVRATHTAGLPTPMDDKLPPVRGASARSVDEAKVPFHTATTNHSDFRDPGSVARRNLVRQYSSGALNPGQNTRISPTTTSHAAFKKYLNTEQALPVLPQTNNLFATDANFSDRTTSKDAYRRYEFQQGAQVRNQSLPPRFSSRSLASEGELKARSSFATRTTNMDTYQNATAMKRGAVAAGLRTTVTPRDGRQVFQEATSNDMTASETCPAALVLSGVMKLEFAGKDHGHDYYNLDS